MAKEILAISEEDLGEFIEILKRGIFETETSGFNVSSSLITDLEMWIIKEQQYLNRLNNE